MDDFKSDKLNFMNIIEKELRDAAQKEISNYNASTAERVSKSCLSILEKHAVAFDDFADDYILQRDGRGTTYYVKKFGKRYSQSELFELYIKSLEKE